MLSTRVQAMASRVFSQPSTSGQDDKLPATRLLLPATRQALDGGAESQACALLAANPSSRSTLLQQPPLHGIRLDGQSVNIETPLAARRCERIAPDHMHVVMHHACVTSLPMCCPKLQTVHSWTGCIPGNTAL